jgi:CHAT domain
MFRIHSLPIHSLVAVRAARPPFRFLLAIAGTATEEMPLFCPLYTVSQLLGPWQVAQKLIDVRIWAPQWSNQELLKFVSGPFPAGLWPFEDVPVEHLREERFLRSSGSRISARNMALWSIVHFVGKVQADSLGEPCLTGPFFGKTGGSCTAGMLRDRLVFCGTRLFILQCSEDELTLANQLAEWVAGGGGPSILVVTSSNPSAVQKYFGDLLANLVHNLPLSVATQIPPPLLNSDLEVDLYLGLEAESSLRLDQWVEELKQNVAQERKDALFALQIMKKWKVRWSKYLHASQIARIRKLHEEQSQRYNVLVNTLNSLSSKLRAIPPQPWRHESEGGVPTAEATEWHDSLDLEVESVRGVVQPAALIKEDRLEAEAYTERSTRAGTRERILMAPAEIRVPFPKEYREWVFLSDREAERAPRVLNAAFRDSKDKTVVDPNQALRPGGGYDLLVDIGPRWNRIKSLVRGQAEFPEYGLDPKENGHEIDVLFVSEQFTPHVATAHLWLPENAGRSHAIVNGERPDYPGPVALQIYAPNLSDPGDEAITAKGRLCLYYRNNLLQAATVSATVAAKSAPLDQENAVDIDFVLSSTFQDLETNFGGRTLSLMLNDDGEGGHRIVAMGGPESAEASIESLPAGWVPYNPSGATGLLNDAREALLSCFFLRDENGLLTNDEAFDEKQNKSRNLGKEKIQFQYDLRDLCKVGVRLFDAVTSAVNVEDDKLNAPSWSNALRKRLENHSTVQVARSVRAEYSFPWALVYDIPMPGPDFKFCRVIDEWNDSGIREKGTEQKECPFSKMDFHLENVYCPYGFWGLKHIVEQPPSVLTKKNGKWVLREAVLEIPTPEGIQLAVGLTGDPELNAKRIDEHVTALKRIPAVLFSAQSPANNLETARAALERPDIVYFLCHGKVNPSNKQFYLGIGDPDDKNHQIYTGTVHGWVDTQKSPNLSAWSDRHPLVFINGCHTADLKPEQTLQFVSEFTYAQASGVLGTEVSVQLCLATDVAQQLLEAVAAGSKIGEALRDERWRLANKGNLIGLAYTLYAMADLRIVRAQN